MEDVHGVYPTGREEEASQGDQASQDDGEAYHQAAHEASHYHRHRHHGKGHQDGKASQEVRDAPEGSAAFVSS